MIHSHGKHVSLQIIHWTRTDVMEQDSLTHVCQAVPNNMLGAHYDKRDVSSFYICDIYCNGRNIYVQFVLFWKCLDDKYVVLDEFDPYSRRQ